MGVAILAQGSGGKCGRSDDETEDAGPPREVAQGFAKGGYRPEDGTRAAPCSQGDGRRCVEAREDRHSSGADRPCAHGLQPEAARGGTQGVQGQEILATGLAEEEDSGHPAPSDARAEDQTDAEGKRQEAELPDAPLCGRCLRSAVEVSRMRGAALDPLCLCAKKK